MNTKINRSDLNSALVSKADIQDVSKAVTEIISTVDCKPEVEELKKALQQKMSRKETIAQFKCHQSMIEDLKKLDGDYKQMIKEQ